MSFQSILKLVLVVLLVSTVPAHANSADDELNEARNIFLKGVDGDTRAVRQAIRQFKALNAHNPDNPVYLAYLGASMTLKGRDAQNNLDKRRLTEDGLAKIDKALDYVANNHNVRSVEYLDTLLVAANSFIYIPSFFNRYEKGKLLLEEILNHEDFSSMAAGYRAAAYFTAALVAHGDGDDLEYRRYLSLAVETEPDGRNGKAAQRLLNEK